MSMSQNSKFVAGKHYGFTHPPYFMNYFDKKPTVPATTVYFTVISVDAKFVTVQFDNGIKNSISIDCPFAHKSFEDCDSPDSQEAA